jgi:hypothetical protein
MMSPEIPHCGYIPGVRQLPSQIRFGFTAHTDFRPITQILKESDG